MKKVISFVLVLTWALGAGTANADFEFGTPAELSPTVNLPGYTSGTPSISADGLLLFFQDAHPVWPELPLRPGGHGLGDLWVTKRETLADAWGTPENLGPTVNSSIWEYRPSVSHYFPGSGCRLYFTRRPGFDPPSVIHEATIKPIVDLNGDGFVNAADMCIMVEYWGTDEPLCDIGPMPWGDGTVDVRDLIVLVEHMTADIGDAATTAGKIIYVDDNAVGANDGSNWADAYRYLQDALADANSADKPVEICVAQGIYKPDQGANQTPGDKDATFQLINDAILKGGFAGVGELDADLRDVEAYETILSGDLAGDDVVDPFDFHEPTREDNICHIVSLSDNIIVATLDGFTITGGDSIVGPCRPAWGPFGEGGGLYAELKWDSSITVINCTFTKNSAALGGGVFIRGGSSRLTNCTFSGNWGIARGGGLYSTENNSTLTNCTFSGNSCLNGAAGIFYYKSNATLTNCILWGDRPDEIPVDLPDSTARITYSNIQGGFPGEGNIDTDPLFADPNNGDYHLKSQAGRWTPNRQVWIQDDVTSPCIDGGNPMSPIGLEPIPHGGIINMGVYGGTAEASKAVGVIRAAGK